MSKILWAKKEHMSEDPKSWESGLHPYVASYEYHELRTENEALRAKVAELESKYDKLNSFVKKFDGTHAADEWLETEMQNIKLNQRIEKLRTALLSTYPNMPQEIKAFYEKALTQDDEIRGAD